MLQEQVDAEFGRALWALLRDEIFENDSCVTIDVDDLLLIALKYGKAKQIKYDPEKHGDIDAEPGSEIWWFETEDASDDPPIDPPCQTCRNN